MFSPIGEIGLTYSRPFVSVVGLEVGVGRGFSGLQLSGMGKLRIGNERTHFTPGVGVSVGVPVFSSAIHSGHPVGEDEARGSSVTMVWLDVDLVGIQYSTPDGWAFSASAGVTVALTEGHWDAIDLGDNIDVFDVLPQVRVGIGRTL